MKDTLQHYGVLGMRWGVRRNSDRPGGADGKPDPSDRPQLPRSKLGKKLNSLKRERQWKEVLMNMDKLSNKQLAEAEKRIKLENDLKTLSKTVGNKHDKNEYLRREQMSNQELSRKVKRLRLKEGLQKAVSNASKEQREFGQKIAQIGGSLGVRYVLNKRLTSDDFLDVLKNPKGSSEKARQDIEKELESRIRSTLSKAKKTTP